MKALSDTKPATRSKACGWIILLSVFTGLWVFAIHIGPWLETRIPVFNRIVDNMERQDIDSGAYFYTEIKASYEGERYLRSALELGAPDQTGFSLQFCLGIFICFLLLAVGFKYLPND
jgi:hypothetical protein